MTVTEESPYVWVDAEIEQRLNLLVSWARTAGENSTEEVTDTELALREAFRDVFRVVNAQREAAVREALRPVHQAMSELWDRLQTYPRTIGYGQGFGDGLDWAHEIFDAMLAKEATDDQ